VEDCKNVEKNGLVMSITASENLLLCVMRLVGPLLMVPSVVEIMGDVMNVNSMVLGVVRSLTLKLQLHYEKMRNLVVIMAVTLEKCHLSLKKCWDGVSVSCKLHAPVLYGCYVMNSAFVNLGTNMTGSVNTTRS
jgi:hypothetical protein